MTEEPERHVYQLHSEHWDWADVDDDEVYPEKPRIPKELMPLLTQGDPVDDVDDLTIYGNRDDVATFSEDNQAVEATADELEAWKAEGEQYWRAGEAFRRRMVAATTTYNNAFEEALRELQAAAEQYKPVEEALKSGSLKLAAKLDAHREAAGAWEEAQEAKQQAHLDAIHGPRVVLLYEPKSLHSANQADRIARVHLVSCKRRPKAGYPERLRAHEAWEKLQDPHWPRDMWDHYRSSMRVKLCASCKPWTVFAEHADVTPQMIAKAVKLTEWPEGMK